MLEDGPNVGDILRGELIMDVVVVLLLVVVVNVVVVVVVSGLNE
jgi:hypothetical protein